MVDYIEALGVASKALNSAMKARLFITVLLVLYTCITIVAYIVLQAKNDGSSVDIKTNTDGNGNVVVAQTSYTNAAIEFSKIILIGRESVFHTIFRLFSTTAWLSIALCVATWLQLYVCKSCPMIPMRAKP
jgi:hypothetical protein